MELSNENIAKVIERIEDFFESAKTPRKDKIKICLLIEEALLRYQEKFGEKYNFELVIRKWFGTPKVLIKVKGKPYNPLEDNDQDQIFSEKIMGNLLNYEKAEVVYRHENGYNEIIAYTAKDFRKAGIPGGAVTILISTSILTAFLIGQFPQQTQNIIINDILTPILNTLLGTLIAINMPLIFISIVASICSIEDITMLNDVGSKIIKRFFILMFLFAFLSVIVCAIFFPVINFNFNGNLLANGSEELKMLFEVVLSMFPQDIFMAFVNRNILQVMTMAFITGICATMLGNRVVEFKNLIMNLKQIIFKLIFIVFKLIPVIIALFIIKAILIYSAEEILTVWKVIAVKYILFASISFIMLLRISMKYGVKIMDFMKKIYPAFIVSLKTGSGIASLPQNLERCKKELKIDEKLCDFYIPLSHTLCSTTLVIGIVVNAFFAAEFSGVEISIAQIFIVAFLAVQFAISAVGGNGGMVATLSLLLTQLGFPLDAIGPIAISDIFTINFSVAAALIVRDCDLFDFSHKVKLS